jgi:hypothetical protein
MSANTTSPFQSVGWISSTSAMRARNRTINGVSNLAFGVPGADPAPGLADGHLDWAHPLDIPIMVEKCVHMVAAHEIRNSFPLDSCRRGDNYPSNTEEVVCPGVHSDVGGGYRHGEGARSLKPGQMLSVVPLRSMHHIAWESGVPLRLLSELKEKILADAFALNDRAQPEFIKLTESWHHYMTQAGFGGRDLGSQINAHMRLYYGWRFYKVRQNQAAREKNTDTQDQAALREQEAQWRQERQAIEKEMAPLKQEADATHAQLLRAQTRLRTAEAQRDQYATAVEPWLYASVEEEQARADAAADKYLAVKARYDTLPGTEGILARNLNAYDDQLLADAEAIRSTSMSSPDLRIRPHYRNLLDAYEAEFVHGTGLRDEKIIEFFDTYVHDSLADFAKDATLPSDPRVVYVGGNEKSRHASVHGAPSSAEAA